MQKDLKKWSKNAPKSFKIEHFSMLFGDSFLEGVQSRDLSLLGYGKTGLKTFFAALGGF